MIHKEMHNRLGHQVKDALSDNLKVRRDEDRISEVSISSRTEMIRF